MGDDCPSPLLDAASAGNAAIVHRLLKHGADVNIQSSSGNTPLINACVGGYEDVVTLLLKSNANVEVHNEEGNTPLMEAAKAGHVEVAKILIDSGAQVNRLVDSSLNMSPLRLAVFGEHGRIEDRVALTMLLMEHGANIEQVSSIELSLLIITSSLLFLIIILFPQVNEEGYTLLMEAAREGREEIVEMLVNQGADINAQTKETQETALTLACSWGFTDVADFLIKAGADIELGAPTPLMKAAQEGDLELVSFIDMEWTNYRYWP